MDSIFELFKHKIENNEKLTPKMQDILEASLLLFAEKGYSNTSTKDIAQAAQVAEGTIFKHFGTKENLLYASILPLLSQSLEDLLSTNLHGGPDALGALSFHDFLRTVLPERMDFAGKNLKIWKIFLTEYLYQETMRTNLRSLIPKDLFEELNRILNLFKEKKEIVDWPNEEIIRLIISIVAGFIIAKSLNFSNATDTNAETAHLILFLEKGLTP
ncbi:TetR/AcrR family transcriptional regulator [Lacticigenium naphthae]|uniref:TetR/AcrR family transcriptional regulator n=1 Tax=Lacticigenium naphthae TaxID=515351 RepID=UPI00041E7807|nr:TetR/AcrR family transcriptional regulator [Lacticigenium naphthae]